MGYRPAIIRTFVYLDKIMFVGKSVFGFVLLTNRISAYVCPNYFIKVRCKIMLSSLADDGYDESEIQKMSKKGIMSFFKNYLAMESQLREKENQLREKENQLNNLKICMLNVKYMTLKGNLNVRGLIEEFEQSDLFKQCRKRLTTVKFTVIDEASNNTSVDYVSPSRKVLWDEALKDRNYASLLACIQNSISDRRDETVGERIRVLYSKVSKEPGESDFILIYKNKLFDHEVSGISE